MNPGPGTDVATFMTTEINQASDLCSAYAAPRRHEDPMTNETTSDCNAGQRGVDACLGSPTTRGIGRRERAEAQIPI